MIHLNKSMKDIKTLPYINKTENLEKRMIHLQS